MTATTNGCSCGKVDSLQRAYSNWDSWRNGTDLDNLRCGDCDQRTTEVGKKTVEAAKPTRVLRDYNPDGSVRRRVTLPSDRAGSDLTFLRSDGSKHRYFG